MQPFRIFAIAAATVCLGATPRSQAPAAPPAAPDRAAIIKAAEHVIERARYCALITVDENGQPQARVVDALAPESGFVVWIGTKSGTRKIAHIRRNPRVTLYYFDPNDPGYVTLGGRAEIVDTPAEKAKRWKEDWASFYESRNAGSDYVLIKVTPSRLEAVSYSQGVLNDPKTWAVPAVSFPSEGRARNPVFPGWYADPEAHVFENRYWIYPTYSAPYDQQTFLDAFSSADLVTWTKHSRVLDVASIRWATRAVWAPSVVEKDGWYYLFFSANDIQNDRQSGGIGVARARHPDGPFNDHLGRPLIDKFHNGAQPIDPFVFKDRDNSYYIVYGGWRHCNIAKLNADFSGFLPLEDGTTFKEITPQGYVEGAFMLLKDGKYYFMWSEGGWTGPNYAVAYAIGTSPFGPFERVGKILQQDPSVATGAGHHSVVQAPLSGEWYIVYHRRPIGDSDRNHRVVCIDSLRFDDKGMIVPVAITNEGVQRDSARHDEPEEP